MFFFLIKLLRLILKHLELWLPKLRSFMTLCSCKIIELIVTISNDNDINIKGKIFNMFKYSQTSQLQTNLNFRIEFVVIVPKPEDKLKPREINPRWCFNISFAKKNFLRILHANAVEFMFFMMISFIQNCLFIWIRRREFTIESRR